MKKEKSNSQRCKAILIDTSEVSEIFNEIIQSNSFKLLQKTLSENGMHIDEIQDDTGRRVTHYAASFENSALIKFANAKHANFNIPDNAKFTPLHYAVESNKKEIVQELVNICGSNLNELNCDSKTPLDLSSHAEISEFLRAKGAKTSAEIAETMRKGGFLPDLPLDLDDDSEELNSKLHM